MIVETVGVGQADVEIVRLAHTTIVVSVPGHGRRHPGDQGRPAGGRRPARGEQGRPAGLGQGGHRAARDAHPGRPARRDRLGHPGARHRGAHAAWACRSWPTRSSSTRRGCASRASWSGASALRRRRRIRSIAKELVVAHTEDPSAREHFDELVTEVAARRSDPAQRRPQSDRGTDQPRPSPGEDVMTMSSTDATKLIEDAVREQVEQELRDWEGGELAEFLSARAREQAGGPVPHRLAAAGPSASTRPPTWRTPPGRTSAFPAATRSPAAPTPRCTAAAPGRCARSPASERPTRPTSASST